MSGAAQARRKRLLQLASAAGFLALVAVAVLLVVSQSQTSGGDTQLEDVGLVRGQLRGIPQAGMVLGDPRAKVRLIEFGDLQCTSCRAYSEAILPDVIDSKVRSGAAKIEFRNYAIIGEESIPAGAAAIAAGEQGHGWSFLELFYRNQGNEDSGYVTDAFLTAIARGAGVPDVARWNRARHAKPALALVERASAEARRLGFTGTPSFAIEGPGTSGLKTLGTPESAADLEAAVDAAGPA